MRMLLAWQTWLGVVALGALLAAGGRPEGLHREPMMTRAVSESPTALVGSVVEDVRLASPFDGAVLAGVLSRPAAPGPHPALVLVSGAGPQDRDGSIAGQQPLRVLAEHFTRAGFAVLRLDDRGVGASAGDSEVATIEMRAADMLGAWELLRARSDVVPEAVGLVGHSEGSTVAALVAAEHPVGFVVSLAGPGLAGHELSPRQVASVLRATGAYPQPIVDTLVDAQRRIVEVIQNDGDVSAIVSAVRAGLETLDGLQPPSHRQSARELAARAERDGVVVSAPWFRSFIKTDPGAAWRRVRCPVLALNGTLDTQVEARENLDEIAGALESAHNPDVRVEALAGLNHLFQPAKTGLVSEYATLDEPFDGEALALVTAWMRERVTR